MGKIYIPITGPSETRIAIHKAIEIAEGNEFSLCVINIIDQESIAKLQRYRILLEEESLNISESMKQDAAKYLDYAKTLCNQKFIPVDTVLLEGNPFIELVNYIQNDNETTKLICIAKKNESDNLKDMFGNLEKKILLKTNFHCIIVGDKI